MVKILFLWNTRNREHFSHKMMLEQSYMLHLIDHCIFPFGAISKQASRLKIIHREQRAFLVLNCLLLSKSIFSQSREPCLQMPWWKLTDDSQHILFAVLSREEVSDFMKLQNINGCVVHVETKWKLTCPLVLLTRYKWVCQGKWRRVATVC